MKHTTLADRPINPRTGLPYHKGTKRYNEWYMKLSDHDKGIVADFEV